MQLNWQVALQYDSVLHALINLYALLVTKKISPKPPNPWMTPRILDSKTLCRYPGCVWDRNSTALNRSRLTRQTHLCNRQMSKANQLTIAEHSGDHGSLWKAFNNILHHCPKMHLPDHPSLVALPNTFSSFFIKKISVIYSSFPTDSYPCMLNPPDTRKVLQNLTCVTADEVYRLILLAPCKSSDLDQVPTSLVEDYIDILIPPITSIVNLSHSEGSFPSLLKSVLVSSPLKKHTLQIPLYVSY